MSELMVPRRFRGPDSSGNGGWTAGALAAHVPAGPSGPSVTGGARPPVQVTLRRPPPLDTPLHVDGGPAGADGAVVTLTLPAEGNGEPLLVAEAVGVAEGPTPIDPVDPATARAAREGYPGLRSHPFPGCFACGPDRAEGDGLRIFPGPILGADAGTGHPLVASSWTPHPSLAGETDGHASLPVTWAALDCVGGWAGDLDERMMVLGRMTAQVDALPVLGEEHVVVGEHRGTEGRRTFTAATLYDADGRIVASATHVWVAVDPATFG